jgi:multidrug resistance efflux pump
MSMLTREFNYMRKSQRVDIPLLVQIGTEVYKTANWSMTGLGLLDFTGDHTVGEALSVRLILPISGASINIDVQVVLKNRRGQITGFEFSNLSERHKRVLRHYVELSLDGNLDNIEDLLSDFAVPEIETPIKEALNITEEEQVSLLRKFRSRAFLTVTAGFLLMGYIIFTLVYNYIFVYRTVGVVSGDLLQVVAGNSGSLKRHYVKVGENVHTNEILFDLDDARMLEQLRQNEEQIERQLATIEQLNTGRLPNAPSRLLELLHDDYRQMEQEFHNAEQLYRQKVISIKDFSFVENNFSRARINYQRELEQQEASRQTLIEKENVLVLQLDLLRNERQRLLENLETLRVRSPINGTVFTIDYHSGEYLSPTDVVVTLSTPDNPFVLFKMPSKQSGRTQLGMRTRVYSFETDQTYEGAISSIGYSAINPRTTLLQEVSLEQTVIKVDLIGDEITIPLNSRVEIWVQQKVPFFDGLLDRIQRPGEH